MCRWQHFMKTWPFQERQRTEQGTETDRMQLNRVSQNILPLGAKGQLHGLTSYRQGFFLSSVISKKCISGG